MSLVVEPSTAAIEANPKAERDATSEVELISLRDGGHPDLGGRARSRHRRPVVGARQPDARVPGRPHGRPAERRLGQVRVLNVSRPPGGLMTSSTPVRLRTAGGQVQSMLVTDNGARGDRLGPDARPAAADHAGHAGPGRVLDADRAAAAVFSRLHSVHSVAPYGEVFSADPSGQHILIYSMGILSAKTVYTTPSPHVMTIAPPGGEQRHAEDRDVSARSRASRARPTRSSPGSTTAG